MMERALRAWVLTGGAVLLAAGAATVLGQQNAITGTTGDDALLGTPGPDRILGLEGADVIEGGDGDDYLEGGPGADEIFAGGGFDVIEARDGEVDLVLCRARGGAGRGAPAGAGGQGLAAVGADPIDRLASCDEGPVAAAIAALIEGRLTRYKFGPALGAELVAIDEVGIDAQDDGFGPRLRGAMKILAAKRHAPTGEPLSRRVLFYAAPKMVANVGEPNDREDWDAAVAAARLAGGVYLQMYHAANGAVTGPATQAEWRAYLPRWSSELGASRGRLRVLFSGVGASQDTQWSWARATPAGRAALRSGAGAYRLITGNEARAWLRNWNKYAK